MSNDVISKPTGDYDYLFKFTLIGDASVGKTNILNRYTKNEFDLDSKSTIGVEFSTKDECVNDKIIRIQIWDTAGQERYRSITNLYYRGAVGVIIVYDTTIYNTFTNVLMWLDQVKCNVDENTIIAIVGNKIDLKHLKAVNSETAQSLANKHNVLFFEVSALNNDGVSNMFRTMAEHVHIHIKQKPKPKEPSRIVLPGDFEPIPETVGSKCC